MWLLWFIYLMTDMKKSGIDRKHWTLPLTLFWAITVSPSQRSKCKGFTDQWKRMPGRYFSMHTDSEGCSLRQLLPLVSSTASSNHQRLSTTTGRDHVPVNSSVDLHLHVSNKIHITDDSFSVMSIHSYSIPRCIWKYLHFICGWQLKRWLLSSHWNI